MVELMTYEGNTNTSSYIIAGIAGADAFTSNLKAAKSTDFTKLSNTIADARALKEKALIQGNLKKDLAKMEADALVEEGKKIKKLGEDSKPRMAGMLAAFTLNGAAGALAGAELKKEMNRESDYSYVIKAIQKAEDSKLDDSESAVKSRASKLRDKWLEKFGYSENSGGSGKKASGAVTEPVTGATVSTNGSGWARLRKVLRTGEGTLGDKGYTTLFGGGQFTDTSRHPDTVVNKNGYSSSAAGAYQFLTPTWNRAAKALDLKDFSPESQEAAGRWLTQQRGVDPDAVYSTPEELLTAIDKLSPEWASMPTKKTGTSYYGQGGLTPDEVLKIYFGS